MRILKNLSIRAKAFAASLVLLLCLIGIGGNAYFTSDRAANGLDALTADQSSQAADRRQARVSDVTAIHLKVFRYVSWASNSVSERLLHSLRAETRSDLRAMKDRIAAVRTRGDLAPAERQLVEASPSNGRDIRPPPTIRSTSATTDAPMATMMLGGTDDDFQKVGASLRDAVGLRRRADRRDRHGARRQREAATSGSWRSAAAPAFCSASWSPCW